MQYRTLHIQVAKLGYSTDVRNRSFQAAVPQTPDGDSIN